MSKKQLLFHANLKEPASESRVDLAWQQVRGWVSQLQAGFSAPATIDTKKITDAMAKAKKPMEFWAVLAADWKTLEIQALVGGTKVTTPWNTSVDKKEVNLWRARLVAMSGELVKADDLKLFDKAHPDPEKLKSLRKVILDSNATIKAATATRDAALKDYAAMGGK